MFESLHQIATGATKMYVHEVVCKCGLRHRESFQVEDLSARTRAADLLLQHGWGRPAPVVPEKDSSELLGKDASEMSGAERAELLALLRQQLERGDSDGEGQ